MVSAPTVRTGLADWGYRYQSMQELLDRAFVWFGARSLPRRVHQARVETKIASAIGGRSLVERGRRGNALWSPGMSPGNRLALTQAVAIQSGEGGIRTLGRLAPTPVSNPQRG